MTHTPGPWHVDGLDKVRADKQLVARVAPWHHYMEYNARLIAAAPALLEALEAITRKFYAVCDDESGVDDDPIYLNAEAAIALAKGEQQ